MARFQYLPYKQPKQRVAKTSMTADYEGNTKMFLEKYNSGYTTPEYLKEEKPLELCWACEKGLRDTVGDCILRGQCKSKEE